MIVLVMIVLVLHISAFAQLFCSATPHQFVDVQLFTARSSEKYDLRTDVSYDVTLLRLQATETNSQ